MTSQQQWLPVFRARGGEEESRGRSRAVARRPRAVTGTAPRKIGPCLGERGGGKSVRADGSTPLGRGVLAQSRGLRPREGLSGVGWSSEEGQA